VTLKIAPGTVIRLSGLWETGIVVDGTLRAVGSKKRPIEFRVKQDNHYWCGISFMGNAAKGALEHCLIQNGRRAAITCSAASPAIRSNVIVSSVYGDGGIFCENEAKPVITGNTIVYKDKPIPRAAIICDNASPTIENNTLKNYAVGVQLYGFKRKPRLRIRGTVADGCQLLVFNETETPQPDWRKVYESDDILRATRLSVQRIGQRETVTAYSDKRKHAGINDAYRLQWRDGKYVLEHEEIKIPAYDPTKVAATKKPSVPPTFVAGNGRTYRMIALRSGAGQMGREGCADTTPAFLLLLADRQKPAKLCWRSPKFARGRLCFTAADLDGDGAKELVICTGRWCEGKGKVLVFRQQVRKQGTR